MSQTWDEMQDMNHMRDDDEFGASGVFEDEDDRTCIECAYCHMFSNQLRKFYNSTWACAITQKPIPNVVCNKWLPDGSVLPEDEG